MLIQCGDGCLEGIQCIDVGLMVVWLMLFLMQYWVLCVWCLQMMQVVEVLGLEIDLQIVFFVFCVVLVFQYQVIVWWDIFLVVVWQLLVKVYQCVYYGDIGVMGYQQQLVYVWICFWFDVIEYSVEQY